MTPVFMPVAQPDQERAMPPALHTPSRRRLTALLAGLALLLLAAASPLSPSAAAAVSPSVARLAAAHPSRAVTVIVQARRGVSARRARALVAAAGGRHLTDVALIHAVAATLPARSAAALGHDPRVRAVSVDASVTPQWGPADARALDTTFNDTILSAPAWGHTTGRGVGVAVVDTGIAGDLADFRTSRATPASRVIASAVANPGASTAGDTYGHGTHVAGIIAGDGAARDASDPLAGHYAGVAPDASLISVKVADDQGGASVLDVIRGLEFVVDHRAELGIRVVNLSLRSDDAASYRTDPLDAAVEAAWLHGIVVVAAAGNDGTAPDAVTHAPANDPYAITVGASDDHATARPSDDTVPAWSSRGTTQDGFAKPDLYAPGAHIVSDLAPGSDFATMCPACVVSGQYIRLGGTSMAAPMVAGAVADVLQAHPSWTPDQVKAAIVGSARRLPGGFRVVDVAAASDDGAAAPRPANQGLTPSDLIDPSTGSIDTTRSSWGGATWGIATGALAAPWARSSWGCECAGDGGTSADGTRSSWGRSSWGGATWSDASWLSGWGL